MPHISQSIPLPRCKIRVNRRLTVSLAQPVGDVKGPPWWKSASLDGFKRHLTGKPWKTLTCHRKIHGFRRWWKLFGDLWCCYISYLHSTNLVVLHGFIRFVKVNLLQNLLLKPELLEARLLPRCLPVSDPCAGQGYLADTCDITCHSVETGVAVRPRSIHQWTGWRENLQRNHRFYVFFTSNYRALPYIFPHNAVNRSQDVACWFNPCRTWFSTSQLDVRLM